MRLSFRMGFIGLAVAAELLVNMAEAQTLRVTSWNLGVSAKTQDVSRVLEEAAKTLRALDSDVVLLQGVRDWAMCSELADLIKPAEYHVVVCSALHAAAPEASEETQVAILSKRGAYFTWSEAWQSPKLQALPRGMAFAAIDSGSQRLGFFSVLGAREQSTDDLSRNVLSQIESLGHWETNKVQTFVIGASFDRQGSRSKRVLSRAARAFDRAGFIGATEDLPLDMKSTMRPQSDGIEGGGDVVFVGPAGVPTDARVTSTPFTDHYPTTCELELDPQKVTLALDVRGEKRREQQELTQRNLEYWAGGVVACCLTLGAAMFLAKVRTRAKLRRRSASAVRILPKVQPGTIRPIIFAQPPPVPPATKAEAALKPRPPALRLQRPRAATPEPPRPSAGPPGETTAPPPQDSQGQKKTLPAERLSPFVESQQTHDVRHGVIRELSGWLKQKLVRKLVTDRAQLMEAQQLAARMANTLDTRLARIEAQIQQQSQAYVRRIEELNKELAAAREENRELIRERIAQVKAEMEAARARVLAEAHLDSKSIRL